MVFFTGRTLFLPLDKRNARDKAKGLRISSERHIGELGVRCLSALIEDRSLGNRLYLEVRVLLLYLCSRKSGGRAANDRV